MKRIISIIAIVFSVFLMTCIPSYAESLNLDKKCTVSITLKTPDTKKPYMGADFSIYYVGNAAVSHSVVSFETVAAFKESGVILDKLDDAESISKSLSDYAKTHSIAHDKFTTNVNGYAEYSGKTGVYLIIPEELGENAKYMASSPFIVYFPYMQDNTWQYSENCSPKLLMNIAVPTYQATSTTTPQSTTTNNPHSSTAQRSTSSYEQTTMPNKSNTTANNSNGGGGFGNSGGSGGSGGSDKDSGLPYTGLLQWPIPLLALIGVILFAAGWIVLNLRTKHE